MVYHATGSRLFSPPSGRARSAERREHDLQGGWLTDVSGTFQTGTLLRPLGVRRALPALQLRPRALPSAGAAGPGGRRWPGPLAEPVAGLYRVPGPPAVAPGDRRPSHHDRPRRGIHVRRRRGGRLRTNADARAIGRPRRRHLAGLPVALRGGAFAGRRSDLPAPGPGNGLDLRPGRAASGPAPVHAPAGAQFPPQPNRRPAEPGHLAGRRRPGRGG